MSRIELMRLINIHRQQIKVGGILFMKQGYHLPLSKKILFAEDRTG
jgi:hypothetical protein